jgi:hypothetical protein
MQPHVGIGLFAVLTALLAGAAIGRIIGLSAGEGLYLTALTVSALGWFIGRHSHRRQSRR